MFWVLSNKSYCFNTRLNVNEITNVIKSRNIVLLNLLKNRCFAIFNVFTYLFRWRLYIKIVFLITMFKFSIKFFKFDFNIAWFFSKHEKTWLLKCNNSFVQILNYFFFFDIISLIKQITIFSFIALQFICKFSQIVSNSILIMTNKSRWKSFLIFNFLLLINLSHKTMFLKCFLQLFITFFSIYYTHNVYFAFDDISIAKTMTIFDLSSKN